MVSIILISSILAEEISIGSKIPGADYFLKNVDGKESTLSSFKKKNGLLVIFSCNTCPWVIRWQDRYNPISDLCQKNNIGFVAVNSNTRLHSSIDSFDEMIYHAAANDYKFPYTLDKNAKLAKAFGATKPPHVYLFNSVGELVYRGASDDNAKNAKKVKRRYLADAINAVSRGMKVKTKTTKALGCSIKF